MAITLRSLPGLKGSQITCKIAYRGQRTVPFFGKTDGKGLLSSRLKFTRTKFR